MELQIKLPTKTLDFGIQSRTSRHFSKCHAKAVDEISTQDGILNPICRKLHVHNALALDRMSNSRPVI
jgi:hypothetical protein